MKYKIKFRYKDRFTNGNWAYQEGVYHSVKECIDWNGLEVDCFEYEILSVERY